MIQPTGDSINAPITGTKDFAGSKNPLREETDSETPSIRVSFSENKILFEENTPLNESLRNEFNQIFQLGADRLDPFLGELDRIAEEAGI